MANPLKGILNGSPNIVISCYIIAIQIANYSVTNQPQSSLVNQLLTKLD